MKSGSYSSVSVHLGGDATIRCHTYLASGPILAISCGDVGVTVTATKHEHVQECDVTNARALAEAAGVYLAECERVYAETHPQADDKAADTANDTADGTESAGSVAAA